VARQVGAADGCSIDIADDANNPPVFGLACHNRYPRAQQPRFLNPRYHVEREILC